MRKCARPRPTKRVMSPSGRALAFCTSCKSWVPAVPVPFGKERRNPQGKITASYAPIAH